MQRYKVTLAYDGTNYVGFQRQINGYSIQAEIERALKMMTKGIDVSIVASGRTDSGVHARGQVIHLDYPSDISERGLLKAMNSLLPSDIRFCVVEKVSQRFHARYHTYQKEYQYRVSLGEVQSPFVSRYALHHSYQVDVDKMKTALQAIIGRHDFTSFCSTKTDKTNKVRCVKRADVEYVAEDKELIFTFVGDGFLYNMVRILVGTALQIGDGLKPVEEFERLLLVKDRNAAGPTAPPHGLYLMRVDYKPEELWFQTYAENKEVVYDY